MTISSESIDKQGIVETVKESSPPTEAPSLFHEQVKLRLCTANVCGNGHEWVPNVALARCGYGTDKGWNGCGSPVLLVKTDNCPVCNEPVTALRLRTDHTPPVPFVIPLCIPGSVTNADVAVIEMKRNPRIVEEEYNKKWPPTGGSENE